VDVMGMLPTSHSAVQSGEGDACVTQPCTHKQEKGPPKTAGECVSKHETSHDYIVTKGPVRVLCTVKNAEDIRMVYTRRQVYTGTYSGTG
jgi:hypothetical protein